MRVPKQHRTVEKKRRPCFCVTMLLVDPASLVPDESAPWGPPHEGRALYGGAPEQLLCVCTTLIPLSLSFVLEPTAGGPPEKGPVLACIRRRGDDGTAIPRPE